MAASRAHGVTLVELMAGLALGAVVVAAATAYTLAHLRDDRVTTARSRLLRELRMAADVIAHDVRRSGYWGGAQPVAWRAHAGAAPAANPYAPFAPASAASDATRLAYAQSPPDHPPGDDEQLGYRLRGGVVEMMLGRDNWQALTDAGTATVTALTIAAHEETVALAALCARPCPAAPPDCGPTQSVRRVTVTVHGRSAAVPALAHAVEAVVRLRNDRVDGTCPEAP